MANVGIKQIRTFSYSLGTLRYLYHSSVFSINGVLAPTGKLLGTILVTVRPSTTQNPFTLYSEKVWAPRAGIPGILLPTTQVITNMYGLASPTSAFVSIEILLRDVPSLAAVTFTEATNLGVAPTNI